MSKTQNQESVNLELKMNGILQVRHQAKQNSLAVIGTEKKCGCTTKGNSTGQKVDLIVLIDTSGSMRNSAHAVHDAVSDALNEAKRQCKPNLKITFLGLDGVWANTAFDTSHRDYIFGLNGEVPLAADVPPIGNPREQGANAIEDLSKYADWREGACKAIFYISDEPLDSTGDIPSDTAATNAAVAEANTNGVTVFAHHLDYLNLAPEIIQNYRDLCDQTGGEAFFSAAPDKDEYVKLLSEAICYACGKCKAAKFPAIKPCISIKWGDSECDCIESSDYEIMSLTVCNCYTNVVLQNYTITMIEVLDSEGNPAPTLPNGTPSVKIHPIGTYCFGDIRPCSCVSREFVIINEGAKAGAYQVVLKGIRFDVAQHYAEDSTSFAFEICKD